LFATSVDDTCCKFAAGVVNTGSKAPVSDLLPVLLTPVANLPLLSIKPAVLVAAPGVADTGCKFANSVFDNDGAPSHANIAANF
jgi:hypothetical protein